MFRRSILVSIVILAAACVQAQERKEIKLLYDFEDPAELEELKAGAENITFDIVQDNGVTHGTSCCRLVCKQGADYCVIHLGKEKIKNWSNFDFFAFDVYSEREEKINVVFELWDAASKNYHTRCTIESGHAVKQGKQTLIYPINRAKRNNKEGRDWSELEPQDKIQMNALSKVKVFFTPPKSGGDLVLWVDNFRILQEDALGGKMKIEVPAGAKAYSFGRALPGFSNVERSGEGFNLTGDAQKCGKHWPDPLSGDGVYDPKGGPLHFEASLPDGEYCVWLSAGMFIDPNIKNPHFLLKIGDETTVDDKPSPADINGEKYLFRFLKTQYSERENALFLDYIDRMYPVYEKKIKVAGGKLTIDAANHWLASLVVLPADQEAAFKKFAADTRAERIRVFNSTMSLDKQKKPAKKDGDGAFLCFIPNESTAFHPSTAPSDDERAAKSYSLAGAPGQRLTFRMGLLPFEDIGKCKFEISTLKGPGEIPSSATRIYFGDYRVRGEGAGEAALRPTNELNGEKNITWCWWAWMQIPADAKPGDYSGTATVTPDTGAPVSFPIALKVYPFKLEEILPFSFGMYYSPPGDEKVLKEQLAFMREIGFTGTNVGTGNLVGINGDSVDVTFEQRLFDTAKAAGMGRHPMQFQMAESLGVARAIGRRLGCKVDQRPGCEFDSPKLHPLYVDFAKKFADYIKKQELPVMVEIVDEPREVPNPWNRNLKETNLYGDWLKEGGVAHTFVDPMGDTQSGLDYTSLADHADIVSTHAGKGSEKLMTLVPQKKKLLHLYNTGMDRLSWGFYNWRVGSVGRWEWHFCFGEGSGREGYLNEHEWYNPFTGNEGFAPHAPPTYPGSMLFKSFFLTCSEGITDSAYLVTLEKALAAAKGDAARSATVAKAKEFLAQLKEAIPFLPDVKGIASAAEGAKVGKGLSIKSEAENWRRQIAEFLIALK
jgi:hypothetical protein